MSLHFVGGDISSYTAFFCVLTFPGFTKLSHFRSRGRCTRTIPSSASFICAFGNIVFYIRNCSTPIRSGCDRQHASVLEPIRHFRPVLRVFGHCVLVIKSPQHTTLSLCVYPLNALVVCSFQEEQLILCWLPILSRTSFGLTCMSLPWIMHTCWCRPRRLRLMRLFQFLC